MINVGERDFGKARKLVDALYDLARALEDELNEIESEYVRMYQCIEGQAERPSCATCKWARQAYGGEMYCSIGDCYVDPCKTDGVCLWEAK